MEKRFNINVDLKRRSSQIISGFKQGDNNDILRIKILQDSLAYDLTDLAVRANFKRPDGAEYFQAAGTGLGIVNPLQGEIEIMVLSEVLDVIGELQADISIFDNQNNKISSGTFKMLVESSVYSPDALQNRQGGDLIQTVILTEQERVNAEDDRKLSEMDRKTSEIDRKASEADRKAAEIDRGTSETDRKTSEIDRKASEADRKAAEIVRETKFNEAIFQEVFDGGQVTIENTEEITSKINTINSQLAEKANQADLNTTNANVVANTNSIATKAEKTYVDTKIGSMGNTKTFKGSCLFADLPVVGMSVDDYWFVSDKTTNYCYNGSSWVDIGNGFNVDDGSIAPLKLSFVKIGKNRFNSNAAIMDKSIDPTGNPYSVTGYFISDFIPVTPDENILMAYNSWVEGNGTKHWQYLTGGADRFAFYDANKLLIGSRNDLASIGTTTTTHADIIVPANAKWMRIASSTGNYLKSIVVASMETYPTLASIDSGYEDYYVSFDTSKIKGIPTKMSQLENDTNFISKVKTSWYGKNILATGDSLTAALKWQLKVAEIHGATVTTRAKGGIGLVTMVDGDGGTLQALTSDDVAGKDLIILFGGMNERSTQYGDLGDLYPAQNTIYGKMQYVINKIYSLLKSANNLTCKILIVTPHCCGKYDYIDADGYTEYPSGSGMTLEKMVNHIKTVGNYNNLRVLDLWHNSGVGKNTWSVYMASPIATVTPPPGSTAPYPSNGDQLHFNDTGYALIGKIIAEEMNRM